MKVNFYKIFTACFVLVFFSCSDELKIESDLPKLGLKGNVRKVTEHYIRNLDVLPISFEYSEIRALEIENFMDDKFLYGSPYGYDETLRDKKISFWFDEYGRLTKKSYRDSLGNIETSELWDYSAVDSFTYKKWDYKNTGKGDLKVTYLYLLEDGMGYMLFVKNSETTTHHGGASYLYGTRNDSLVLCEIDAFYEKKDDENQTYGTSHIYLRDKKNRVKEELYEIFWAVSDGQRHIIYRFLDKKKKYKYHKTGQKKEVRYSIVDSDTTSHKGLIAKLQFKKYDPITGKASKIRLHDVLRDVILIQEISYDESSNVVEVQEKVTNPPFNRFGLDNGFAFIYTPDSLLGHVVPRTLIELSNTKRYFYKYDEKGNWIEKILEEKTDDPKFHNFGSRKFGTKYSKDFREVYKVKREIEYY